MSEQIATIDPENPGGRGRMPWSLRLMGGFAIFVITFVTLGAIYDIFRTEGKPLNTLQPQGPQAESIQSLVKPVFYVAGVVFVLILVGTLVIVWKFRERLDDDEEEFVHQTEGNTVLEITWTAIPALVLAVIGVFTVVSIQDLQPELAKPDVLKVRVEGQQWWWGFRYDLGDTAKGEDLYNGQNGSFTDAHDVVTATELVIPAGREVQLKITSNDVIHSFWIPALNGKKDAVPGMENDWKIQAAQPGVYLGQCTEFCGLSHANMRMLVRALPEDEFRAWVEHQRTPAEQPSQVDDPEAYEGMKYFQSAQCAQCHLIRGLTDETVADPTKGVATQLVSAHAPDLTHFMSRGMFAGAIFNLHYPDIDPVCEKHNAEAIAKGTRADQLEPCDDPANNSNPGNPAKPLNRAALEEWLRDPPGVKPMCPVPVGAKTCDPEVAAEEEIPEHGDLRLRGMPNLGLSEEQINQVVAYLETLK